MARQLHEQGEDVPLVILISPRPARSSLKRRDPRIIVAMRFYLVRLRLHWERIKDLPLRSMPSYWLGRMTGFSRRIAAQVKLAPNSIESSDFWRARPHLKKAIINYEPGVFPGHVTLLLPEQRVKINQDWDFGWGRVAKGGVDVHTFPGDHLSMFLEPNIRYLAQEIRAIYHKNCAFEMEHA
jgi:thioesterase domain-containing protein